MASAGRDARDVRGNDTRNASFCASGRTERDDCLVFVFCYCLFFFVVVVVERFLLFFRKVRHPNIPDQGNKIQCAASKNSPLLARVLKGKQSC